MQQQENLLNFPNSFFGGILLMKNLKILHRKWLQQPLLR